MTELRYRLELFIGPCAETERDALMDAILTLPEAEGVGVGAVSARPTTSDEDADLLLLGMEC